MPQTAKRESYMESSTTPQSQPAIHPLFAKEKFARGVDWEKGFRVAATLATRLLDTPQALHWVYAFLCGINEDAEPPENVKGTSYGGDPNFAPRKYACNKGVGQLSADDVSFARDHLIRLAPNIRFKVEDLSESGCVGQCRRLGKDHLVIDTHGYPSSIYIDEKWYKHGLVRDTNDPEEAAKFDFYLAVTMLHEVAHALCYANMGEHRAEDFFETSLVGEAGWELESRLFGMCPRIVPKPKESYWHIWQTQEAMANYDLKRICRHAWKLPKSHKRYGFHPEFAIKLLSDAFWEEDYVEQGALAIIPPWVEFLCLSGQENNQTRGIPQSIRDLYRDNPKSYAEKKYGRFANPRRILRGGYPDGQGPDEFQYQDLDHVASGADYFVEGFGSSMDDDKLPRECEAEDHIYEYFDGVGIHESELNGLIKDQRIGVFKPANDEFNDWSDGEGDEAVEYQYEDLPDTLDEADDMVFKPEVEELADVAQYDAAVVSLLSAVEDVEMEDSDDEDAEMTDVDG